MDEQRCSRQGLEESMRQMMYQAMMPFHAAQKQKFESEEETCRRSMPREQFCGLSMEGNLLCGPCFTSEIARTSLFGSSTCDFSSTLWLPCQEQVMSKLQVMEESFQRQMETSQEAIAQRWGDEMICHQIFRCHSLAYTANTCIICTYIFRLYCEV